MVGGRGEGGAVELTIVAASFFGAWKLWNQAGTDGGPSPATTDSSE